jgi:type IV pilus assembly protein PilA
MSIRTRHSRAGFTLIELMIVVAILGILAAVAIPNYLRFQLRARSSEGKTNLAALRTAEEAHFAEHDAYLAAAVTPVVPPGTTKQSWPAVTPGCPSCFDSLAWAPEGDVLFQYEVVAAQAGGGGGGANVFTAAAAANTDGDGTSQIWGYVRALPGGAGGIPSTLVGGLANAPCPATGTWNTRAMANTLLDTVAPCDPNSGSSVF